MSSDGQRVMPPRVSSRVISSSVSVGRPGSVLPPVDNPARTESTSDSSSTARVDEASSFFGSTSPAGKVLLVGSGVELGVEVRRWDRSTNDKVS